MRRVEAVGPPWIVLVLAQRASVTLALVRLLLVVVFRAHPAADDAIALMLEPPGGAAGAVSRGCIAAALPERAFDFAPAAPFTFAFPGDVLVHPSRAFMARGRCVVALVLPSLAKLAHKLRFLVLVLALPACGFLATATLVPAGAVLLPVLGVDVHTNTRRLRDGAPCSAIRSFSALVLAGCGRGGQPDASGTRTEN